jgi:hypothetical protein
MHASHLFVCSATSKNDRAGISVVTMELLVARGVSGADGPHNHIIHSIA